jgi:hypothetical protein
MIQRLIRHIACVGVGAIIEAAVPWNAESLSRELIAALDAGTFLPAKSIDIAGKNKLAETHGVHCPGNFHA